MKTLILLSLTITLCISCTKDPKELIDPKNVYITFDYAFPKSGDIAPKGESAYLTFYHKYIESKILTPRTYYANLYDADKLVGASIYGIWGKKSLFVVPPGKYVIEGISWPVTYVSSGMAITNSICGDTAYLKFHDTITVTQTSTNILLNAQYDCSLVLLDTTEVKSTMLFAIDTTNLGIFTPYSKSVKREMMKTEEFYHSFLFNGTLNGIGYDKVDLYLSVTTTRMEMVYHGPGTTSYDMPSAYLENIVKIFPLWVYQMQPGKYYFFENTANGYTLTPMTSN